jgi:hypothetical protein
VFDQHRVPREERRHDHVDGDQKGVVPGGDVQHDSKRLVADEPLEPRLGRERLVGQGGFRQPAHGLRAIDHGRDLVLGLLEGLAHLAGDVERDLVGHGPERGDHLTHEAHPLGDRRPAPVPLDRTPRRRSPGLRGVV